MHYPDKLQQKCHFIIIYHTIMWIVILKWEWWDICSHSENKRIISKNHNIHMHLKFLWTRRTETVSSFNLSFPLFYILFLFFNYLKEIRKICICMSFLFHKNGFTIGARKKHLESPLFFIWRFKSHPNKERIGNIWGFFSWWPWGDQLQSATLIWATPVRV